jgi:hypothetical protein
MLISQQADWRTLQAQLAVKRAEAPSFYLKYII